MALGEEPQALPSVTRDILADWIDIDVSETAESALPSATRDILADWIDMNRQDEVPEVEVPQTKFLPIPPVHEEPKEETKTIKQFQGGAVRPEHRVSSAKESPTNDEPIESGKPDDVIEASVLPLVEPPHEPHRESHVDPPAQPPTEPPAEPPAKLADWNPPPLEKPLAPEEHIIEPPPHHDEVPEGAPLPPHHDEVPEGVPPLPHHDEIPEGAPPPPPPPPAPPGALESQGPPPGDHRLVLLIPQDSPTPDLCKTIFSGMANGYPSPIILNWDNDRDRVASGLDTSHLYKIIKGVSYLDKMMAEEANEADRIFENDLIIIVDALDVWWQLPPDLLIKRYHDLNRDANERLAKQWDAPGPMPMKQTIIAGAGKRCWPDPSYGIELHCDELPISPERPDLYGESTDVPGKDHAQRPRNFNAGTIIGPAGDLRRFFRRTLDRMSRVQSHHPKIRTDQGLQGEVWGEQEMFRNWLRRQPNRSSPEFLNDPMVKTIIENFEYGVSVDYFQQLWMPTNTKELDAEFLLLNNQTYIDIKSAELAIEPVRLRGVPEDVKNTKNPLLKVLPENEVGDWGDLSLFADFFSQAVPVVVHHNAYLDGLKERRKWWWDRTWFFPHLRRLVTAYLERPLELPVLGRYPVGEEFATYRPLPSELTRRRPRRYEPEMAVPGLPEMDYGELCKGAPDDEQWFDQVFRDGKGPL